MHIVKTLCRRALTRLGLCTVLLASTLLWTPTARAKSMREVSHPYEKLWPATVRFLRIDEGLTVLEKDMESGYVLFVLVDDGTKFRGSVELIRKFDDENRPSVRIVLSIKKRPDYMEEALLDRMLMKFREELGLPPDSPPPKKSAPSPDKKPTSPKTEARARS